MRKTIGNLMSSFAVSLCLMLSVASAQAAPYTDIVIFGDSLSDSGNFHAATGFPPPPYFNGQFSNGPVWALTFAQHFGLNANPLSLGGHNYAFAGATTGVTGVPNGAPTLLEQKASYLAGNGGAADPNALYVVFGGGNDIADALLLNNPALIADGIGNVVNMIGTLYGAGARNILVANVPDIGHTPQAAAAGPDAQLFGTFFSSSWNNALSTALGGFSGLPGLDIDLLDIAGLEASVFANPAAFGYANITEPCFNGISVCANPGEYYYWDLFHPTAQGHLLIAQEAISLVPEPGVAFLMGLGLAMLAARRKKG